jgi:HD-GYP domain-containing protein (c-di-GMP phosphodiesterase class II)
MDEIASAQGSLGRAVARARAGEDRELAQRVRELGEQAAHMLAGLIKMSRVHAADNRAFDAPAAEFRKAIGQLVELLGPVHLVTVEDQVFVNDIRIRSDAKAGARDLGAKLQEHNVGGATFHAPLAEVQVRALLDALAQKPPAASRRGRLQRALFERGVDTIELHGIFRFRTRQESEVARVDPAEARRRALQVVAETWDNLASGRLLNPLPLRHSVVDIIEIGPQEPAFWEVPPEEGPPHARHALAVAMTSLLVGAAAGLSRGLLQDLGLAALLHDIGYASLPADAAGLERHPGEGARLLLRQRGFHEAKLRRVRAVLDHHRDYAGPQGPPSLGGCLLRLCDDYDNLLRLWPGKVSPADALGAVAAAAGRLYHPTLVQLLVNSLGRYPPGTLLELEDGRWARSISPARTAETFAAPLARLQQPGAPAPGGVLDLARGPRVRRALPG